MNQGDVLSAGDLDEAVVLLMNSGPSNLVIDTAPLTTFERTDAFRIGATAGLTGCGL